MGQSTPIELIKIKKIVAEIHEFPAKIDSTEQAKNARQVLKKYALLSEKIERNVLINTAHQKDLAKIRTEEFKAIRSSLKEKANLILHEKNNYKVQGAKIAKKSVKATTSKKTLKATDGTAAKETNSKKTVQKS